MSNPLLAAGTGGYSPAYAGHDWQDLNPLLPPNAQRFWEMDEQLRGFTARFSGAGGGDAQQLYVATAGQYADWRIGTSGAPDTSPNPGLKVTRTVALDPVATGNNAEQQAAVTGLSVGVTGNKVQVTGLAGIAINRSATVDFRNDSCGVFAYAVQDVATGNAALGLFAGAVRNNDSSYVGGVEVQVKNHASAVSAGNVGSSQAVGISITASADTGSTQIGAGITLGRAGPQMDVGLNVPSFSTIGDGLGPCKTAVVQDNGMSLWSMLVKGSHANAGIAIDDQAGALIIGQTTRTGSMGGALLVVRDSVGSSVNPLVWYGSQSSPTKAHAIRFGNDQSDTYIFVAGAAGNWLAGTAIGDSGIVVRTTGKAFHIGGQNSGSRSRVVTVTEDGKLGFFAATPVAKQAATVDLRAALINLGVYTTGGASPLDLNGGALTAGSVTLADAGNVAVGTTTGTKIGTAATQKLGFWNATPVVRPAAYTPTNVTADRGFDANSTSIDELADIVGTLITDLQTIGLLG